MECVRCDACQKWLKNSHTENRCQVAGGRDGTVGIDVAQVGKEVRKEFLLRGNCQAKVKPHTTHTTQGGCSFSCHCVCESLSVCLCMCACLMLVFAACKPQGKRLWQLKPAFKACWLPKFFVLVTFECCNCCLGLV